MINDDIAYEIWAAAQLMPWEGIEDGATRIIKILEKEEQMKLEETRVPVGGTFRCCLGSVATEYLGKEVEVGDSSECEHCHAKFVLGEDKIWRRVDENNKTKC